ncbi:MAG: penicillin acylase family protein [bacterium]|nr:penicillin acylase family protein [bacterium]
MVLVVLVVVVAGGFVLYTDTTQGPLPQVNGELNVAGLNERVEVLRDSFGVPHIYAASLHDLYFAQGYTQAQDRWWQMEFWRHTGDGRIQELTGRTDSLLGTDVFIQTVGWRRAAERDAAAMDDETRALMQAFADGVNAYILSRPQDDLALEYRILGLTGVRITVEPWTIEDSLVWGKILGWNLTASYDRELTRQTLFAAVGEAMAADFTPPYPYDQHETILFPDDLPLSDASLAGMPLFARADASTPASLRVAGGLKATDTGREVGIGSNNWVAAGAMTATGTPLLANDPHLGIQMPSIWYEVGLHCAPITEACPVDVVGFTFAPNAGVITGTNGQIAWGVTNTGADVQDLYQIRVNPENPLQYEYNGEWRDMTVIDAEIRFGDSDETITFQVRETHFGPIINDNDIDPETGALTGFNNTDPVALRWTALEPSELAGAIFDLNRANDWESFRAALSRFSIPSQNFVYADVNGNIGYQMPGNIPIRAADHSGILPVPGWTDEYEWRGYRPFDSLPRIFNPERDFIATANQAITPPDYEAQVAALLGDDANYSLAYDYSYGYRGQRIVDLLRDLAPHTPETFAQIQGDNYNLAAEYLIAALNTLEIDDPTLSEIRDWLAAWDMRNDIDSAPAVLFAHFAQRLIDNVYGDQLPEDITPTQQQVWAVTVLLQDPENVWWDDANTADIAENRDTMLLTSLEQAWDAAQAAHGADRVQWRWGAVHTATFVSNPLGLSGIDLIENMVNRGAVETGGGSEIVNATGSRRDFTVGSLPSYRMIVDLANLDNSRSIHTTGQSGHPFSAHYDDMIELWRTIEYKPMLFTRAAVEAAAQDRLTLLPGN